MTLRSLRFVWGSLALAALMVCAAALAAWNPAWLYRVTGSQRYFNIAVSRAVPRGATLAQLESVVGPGQRVADPSWSKKCIERMPSDNPDGWREGDVFVSYSFPGKVTWYFQARDGRLINYEPAVLAGQPQEHIALISRQRDARMENP
ncbi:MAG: hypothetical protein P4L85_12445 [Paludisphaera borealis]|uniref:hypothetical protein n=1 Tax=Paludisphaera borealis TaxID=1387353 RepID=UPI00284F02E1|nr:hypothetical protein [Paludisphaera borealis]MDR3620154.1 hypothetical protein [Paludisphaera borealis]